MKTFEWTMNMGASKDTQFRVNRTQFGDDYAQLSTIGINNKTEAWSGNKTGDYQTVIKPIEQFLDEHAGSKPFIWTDPNGHTKQYICAGYSSNQRKGNMWQISLKFEQFTSV